ncbi:RPA2 [Cordylochernes scorpioides]|uniref:RPA2 n=1 Tax=Cordylochernes scorpioides TaxID=51811 RepID=A0ABY6L7C9_9ARAC|nr:RPA2 [Cordylochernes scorpioides]
MIIMACTTCTRDKQKKKKMLFQSRPSVCEQLTIVGIVTAIDEQSSKILYQIDDLTGPPLEVHLWMGESEGADRRSSISENSYVRAVGSLRSQEDKKLMIAFRIMPLHDLNDLTIHLLEAVRAHMVLSREELDNKENSMMAMEGKPDVSAMDTTAPYDNMTSIMRGMTKSQKVVSWFTGNIKTPECLKQMSEEPGDDVCVQVFQTILSSKSERGISLSELTSKIKGVSQNIIR